MNIKHKKVIVETTAEKTVKMRPAMAMMDLILAIGISGALVGAVIWMWIGAKPKIEMSNLTNKIITVISGIEKAKDDYNTGAFISSAEVVIGTNEKLRMALGGAKVTDSLGAWKYSCPTGNDSTVTLKTEPIGNPDVLTGVKLGINDKFQSWVATVDTATNSLTIAREHSVCK